jgi:hypothetical protein
MGMNDMIDNAKKSSKNAKDNSFDKFYNNYPWESLVVLTNFKNKEAKITHIKKAIVDDEKFNDFKEITIKLTEYLKLKGFNKYEIIMLILIEVFKIEHIN